MDIYSGGTDCVTTCSICLKAAARAGSARSLS